MERYIIANCTDTGRVRAVNEDSMVTFESPNGHVVVVCDGMGGQNAGDVASQLAVTVIQDILTDNTFASPDEAISSSILAANQAILRRASQDLSLSGMGSTCVMLIIKDGVVYYGSVGDSRIYYIANGMIQQLTKDQSYVQTLVDAGQLSPEDAERHQDKNQITNALGIESMTPPVLGTAITPVQGSTFLLCSDGLSGMVPNHDILTIVSRSDVPLGERAKMLVNKANENGGADNVTVQLVEFGGKQPVADASPTMAYGSRLQSKPKAKKSSKIVAILSVVLLLFVICGGVYWFLSSKKTDKKETKAPTMSQPIKNTSVDNRPSKQSTSTASYPSSSNRTESKKATRKQPKSAQKQPKSVSKSETVKAVKKVEKKTTLTKDLLNKAEDEKVTDPKKDTKNIIIKKQTVKKDPEEIKQH